MDIWNWLTPRLTKVAETDPRLAWNIRQLSHWTVNDQHDRVDATFPEILAGVRRLKDPWLEIFVRHWRLQSLVLDRHDVKQGLPEAIDLLERAHRDDARDCPQTTCVSQDVCAAYGCADGPGWAKERLKVSAETLERIDPTWACWTCISGEYADALIDDGRPEEALVFVQEQLDAMRSAGEEVHSGELAWQVVDALLTLERLDEALAICEKAENPLGGSGFELAKRVETARCLVALERLDEGEAQLPSVEEMKVSPSLWEDWSRARLNLVWKRREGWTREVRNDLVGMADSLEKRGNVRHAFRIWYRIGHLDMASGQLAEAQAAETRARAVAERLRKPCGAEEELASFTSNWEKLDFPTVPETREEAELAAQAGLNMTEAALLAERFPDWWELVSGVANTWRASLHPEKAREVLERSVAHGVEPALFALANLHAEEGDPDALDALLAEHPVKPGAAAFFASVAAQLRGDGEGAIAALQGQADPQLLERRLGLLYNRRDWAATLSCAQEGIALGAPPGDLDWKLLVAATFAEDHAAARASAERLGFELQSTGGPIEEPWGPVVLDHPEGQLLALRTGPVTARVVQVTGPQKAERHGDEVVFEPIPLNPDQEEAWRIFPLIGTRVQGGYRGFGFDARHPGKEDLERFTKSLDQAGYSTWISSGPEYTLDEPDGEELPGLYLRVAVPPDGDLEDLARRLAEPPWGLAWLELAQAVGDPAEVARQLEVVEAWEL